MIWGILNGFLGIAVLLGIVYGLSANRAAIKWRTVITGLMMQFIIASMLLLKIEIGGTDILYPFKWMIQTLSQLFVFIINFTVNGSKFIFGPLADSTVMNNIFPNNGFVFAFMALTTIIFFGSFMAILYHLGVMQFIIRIMARLMVKFLNISGSEAIAVTANIFVGQTEAPLVIKPYVEKMTKSELLTLMIGGMATIAGGVMAAYIAILGGPDPAQQVIVASRLLTASFMAAPATIVIAKMLIPETEHSLTYGKVELIVEKNDSNVIEAAANGAGDGMKLALNVAAMLLAFTAIIALLNDVTAKVFTDLLGMTINSEPIKLTTLIGYAFSVFGLIIGVTPNDAVAFGSILGQKVILNEFFAYIMLGQVQTQLAEKTVFLATFALCGFANFSSIAIQIGGIGGIAPSRKSDLAKFGIKSVIGGSIATLLTASIAGIFFAII